MAGLFALAMAYVLSQFYRSFLSVLTPQLTADLGASTVDLSRASGVWFLTFALMQFVVGVCLDRFGPRRTTSWMFGLAGGSGALIFATAQSPSWLVLAMALIGIGCAPVLMASVFIFGRQFDPSRFALMSSWMVAFGTLGNVVSASPLAAAADNVGWRGVMLGLAATNLLVALMVHLLVSDPEPEHDTEASNAHPAESQKLASEQLRDQGLRGYWTLIRIPALWAILPLMLLSYATVAGIRGLWTGPFLTDLYQADGELIGQVTLWMALAMVTGSFLYGPMDRWLNTRKWVVFGGNSIMFFAVLTLYLDTQPTLTMVTILFMLIGVSGTSFGVMMSHGRAFVPTHLLGRGVTLLNFFGIFGVGLMQLITGSVVRATTDPANPVAAYQSLYLTYAVLLGAALIIYLASRDAPPRP